MTMDIEDVAWPAGFRAYTGQIGLRDDGADFSVIISDRPCVSAAMFTRSLFAGASVLLSRRHAAEQRTRAIVTVAKNANVATGTAGERNAGEVVDRVASVLGIPPAEVLISSTGVIGRQYPMPLIRSHIDAHLGIHRGAVAGTDPDPQAHAGFTSRPVDVATAMMTTDTHAKVSARAVGPALLVGVAKGVGMIEPDMATMLAYLVTDAELPAAEVDGALRAAVEDTFNCLSVDTDTSTSDTVALLANGAAGPVDAGEFAAAVREVCLDLTRQLAADGEGATKLLTVTVTRARDRAQAKRVAKAVLNSPLVKTAVHGADPNWGRVVMAIGKCSADTDIHPERVRVRFGDLEVFPRALDDAQLERLTTVMAAPQVEIGVSLDTGEAACTVYGCDLSDGYVRINADYTT